jgi:hypothetical protein
VYIQKCAEQIYNDDRTVKVEGALANKKEEERNNMRIKMAAAMKG